MIPRDEFGRRLARMGEIACAGCGAYLGTNMHVAAATGIDRDHGKHPYPACPDWLAAGGQTLPPIKETPR